MDKSDGIGGKNDKCKVKKSESSEDGGKVNKFYLVGTLNLSVINKVLA